jgi:hypothetical protein
MEDRDLNSVGTSYLKLRILSQGLVASSGKRRAQISPLHKIIFIRFADAKIKEQRFPIFLGW